MKLLISLVFLLSGTLVWSQSSKYAAWFDYNHAQYLNPDLAIVGDAGYRIDSADPSQQIAYLRPGVKYRFNSTYIIQGNLATFLTFSEGTLNRTEYRLAQEGVATWPRWKNLHIDHRLRFEQRFFRRHLNDSDASIDRSDEAYRARYMLSATSNYFNVGPVENAYTTASVEYFLPMDTETKSLFSNQTRAYVGFGQLLNKGWSYVVHLMWQRSTNPVGEMANHDFILRLRLYWKSSV
jgi:hypothetical protein